MVYSIQLLLSTITIAINIHINLFIGDLLNPNKAAISLEWEAEVIN